MSSDLSITVNLLIKKSKLKLIIIIVFKIDEI